MFNPAVKTTSFGIGSPTTSPRPRLLPIDQFLPVPVQDLLALARSAGVRDNAMREAKAKEKQEDSKTKNEKAEKANVEGSKSPTARTPRRTGPPVMTNVRRSDMTKAKAKAKTDILKFAEDAISEAYGHDGGKPVCIDGLGWAFAVLFHGFGNGSDNGHKKVLCDIQIDKLESRVLPLHHIKLLGVPDDITHDKAKKLSQESNTPSFVFGEKNCMADDTQTTINDYNSVRFHFAKPMVEGKNISVTEKKKKTTKAIDSLRSPVGHAVRDRKIKYPVSRFRTPDIMHDDQKVEFMAVQPASVKDAPIGLVKSSYNQPATQRTDRFEFNKIYNATSVFDEKEKDKDTEKVECHAGHYDAAETHEYHEQNSSDVSSFTDPPNLGSVLSYEDTVHRADDHDISSSTESMTLDAHNLGTTITHGELVAHSNNSHNKKPSLAEPFIMAHVMNGEKGDPRIEVTNDLSTSRSSSSESYSWNSVDDNQEPSPASSSTLEVYKKGNVVDDKETVIHTNESATRYLNTLDSCFVNGDEAAQLDKAFDSPTFVSSILSNSNEDTALVSPAASSASDSCTPNTSADNVQECLLTGTTTYSSIGIQCNLPVPDSSHDPTPPSHAYATADMSTQTDIDSSLIHASRPDAVDKQNTKGDWINSKVWSLLRYLARPKTFADV